MLVSPRPTAILPQSPAPCGADTSPVTTMGQTGRSSFIPRADVGGYIPSSPMMASNLETSAAEMPIPAASALTNGAARQANPNRSPSATRPELPREGSTASVVSRGSSASLNRSMSRDNMSRSMSNASVGGSSRKKQFVVKSKASRSRPGHLTRTPSQGKGLHQLTSISVAHRPMSTSPSEILKKGHGSVTILPDHAKAPMRPTPSPEARQRKSSSSDNVTPSAASRPRRPSNLRREAPKTTMKAPNTESSDNSGSDAESETDAEIEMRKPERRISDRQPNPPPTLQLRRTSNSDIQPRVISGLTGIARTPPQFAPSTASSHSPVAPSIASAAPPFLNTKPVIVTDLPASVGSVSSARERIAHLRNGEIPPEDVVPKASTASNSSQSLSPSNERSSSTSGNWKPISLENTRYALDHEAQDMIRRLSNGPPGMVRQTRPSSPSPSTIPSGWTRPERTTRTMQRQMTRRDLEREASEQHYGVISPVLVRPDSRTDYFSLPMNDDAQNGDVEEDPFFNTNPRLNAELRRITRELNNVKLFGDPVGDALRRLGERKGGLGSPIVKTATPPKRTDSILSVSSSWRKRFSPDKTDKPENNAANQPSTSSQEMTRNGSFHHLDVFQGEQASRLREVTRRLWDSWPERPVGREQEPEQTSTPQEPQPPSPERSTSTIASTSSPTRNRSQSPVERRTFGSGLRETWGSALALAGLR